MININASIVRERGRGRGRERERERWGHDSEGLSGATYSPTHSLTLPSLPSKDNLLKGKMLHLLWCKSLFPLPHKRTSTKNQDSDSFSSLSPPFESTHASSLLTVCNEGFFAMSGDPFTKNPSLNPFVGDRIPFTLLPL